MQRRTLVPLALVGAAALALAGCSQPGADGGDAADGELDRLPAVTIVTGGTAGLFYPIGGALRQIVSDEVEGTTASVESTGASVENIQLIGSGQAELAIAQGDAANQALNGLADFEGREVRTSTLAVLYPNVYHTVSLAATQSKLGLECFKDVAGTRFSVGDIGSGNEATANQVFESLGMDPETDIDRRQLGYAETSTGLTSGGVDAGTWVVGQGHAGITELATTDDVVLIPMCDDERKKILDGYGGYVDHVIPAGTYPGVDVDTPTIATWNALVAPENFNEEQAYDITKAVFENVDVIEGVYAPAVEFIVPENIENAPVPVHPGALKYYDEVGIDVPAELRG